MRDLEPLKRDFRVFLQVVWAFLKLPEPTPVQYDIARYLQTGPKRLVIEAFRGVGKSWITSAFVLWLLFRDPELKILVVSASKERADQFSTFTLRLIREMELLRHLAPDPKRNQRDSKIAFDVGPSKADHSPSVKSVGITGQLTGSRANVIIADDVEIPNNSATQLMRDKLSEAVKEFDAILKSGDDGVMKRIIYLGTPQTEMSLYNTLPERGYEVRIWPARYPTEKLREVYGEKLAPSIARAVAADPKLEGKPTDPKRFNELDLLERESSYGRSGFALQFMLDTRLSDADRYPLRLRDLVVMALDHKTASTNFAWGLDEAWNDLPNVGFAGDRYYKPAWVSNDPADRAEYQGCVMAIDPSGRGKDETAYAITRMLYGKIFLVASGGFRSGYDDETLEALARLAKLHSVNKVIIEPNFGDGMFLKLLTPVFARIYPCTLEESERSNSQKEKRIIDTLEPVMNQHRLVVDPEVIRRDYASTEGMADEDVNRYRLFYQLTRITKDKGSLVRDDRVDALALAVAYWLDHMQRDTEQAVKDHRSQLLDAELELFMEHAVGYRPRPASWIHHRNA